MEELENHFDQNKIVFSKTIMTSKRTYFFDIKNTKSDKYYLEISERKRRFDNNLGKFIYEKHKLFLYKEDFKTFVDGLNEVINLIQSGKIQHNGTSLIEKSVSNVNDELSSI